MNSGTCCGFTALKECSVCSAVTFGGRRYFRVEIYCLEVVWDHRRLLYLESNKQNCAITIHLFHLLFSVGSSDGEWVEVQLQAFSAAE